MDSKIDFVITWVNDSDPKWRNEFEYYSAKEVKTINADICRYRDWDTLRYWFRGVERFAPWFNKIYFITYEHLPEWLNVCNPKLVVVKHEDFIPAEYLPTFHSDTIEFNIHRINGLADRFVYFNDDTFIIDNVPPDRFFKNGLPCDIGMIACMNHAQPDIFDSSVFLATALVNSHFDKKAVIHKDFWKWYPPFHPLVAKNNSRFHSFKKFPGFVMNHLPKGYMKQTYEELWKYCEEHIRRTCSDRFRSYGDVCSWLLRYWQLASGCFTPYNIFKDGIYFGVNDTNVLEVSSFIIHQKKRIICLNDTPIQMNFEVNKRRILDAFEAILPNKSSFEQL